MPAIEAHSLVHAYHDLGSGGSFWVALPDVFQSDNLVVATTGYTYTAGIFILAIESSALSSVLATATVMDGYLLKVVVATPG